MVTESVTPQENFMAWLDEHYEPYPRDGLRVCRRCGMPVGYVTKHAVVRHGDAIEVMPVAHGQAELADIY